MMRIYRIAACRFIDDLSGTGAALYGGRWNTKGTYLLYTAATPALALVENLVRRGRLADEAYCLITLELPDNPGTVRSLNELPPDWKASLQHPATQAIGDAFVRSGKHLALRVPSALLAEESNILLNPQHPAFASVKMVAKRSLDIDKRLVH